VLEIKNLHFSYAKHDKRRRYEVIRNLSFSVKDNEFVSVIGPSGCGKSTLLKIIAGFELPTEGEILYSGEKVAGIGYERAMVFQEDAVFPWMRVRKNVEYGLKSRGVDPVERKKRADYFIDAVALRGFENAWPKELSGGMKKRVDLARVLANDPELLLMDEPFGALDAMTKELLQEELLRIWEDSKKMILFVTHDIEEALFLADRVIVVQHIKNGGRAEIIDVPFERPRSIKLKENPEFQKSRRAVIELLRQYENE
jgi:ABC-type nitrate/sulfonate/bicarbonate transport system ATPase subunit